VSLTKLVDKTVNVAEASARTLLDGPGQYSSALKRVIPEGTQLRGIRIENGIVTVDFTQPFAAAADKAAAVRTVASTMTTINGIKAVQILVEGAPLSTVWGNDYNKNFERPPVNPE
jgi:spore germination protein GerM